MFVPSKNRVSASPSPVKVCNQIPLAFKVRLLGDSQSLSQPGKVDVGLRTFTIVGEFLWYYCSPIFGLLTWWVWDFYLWLLLCHKMEISLSFFGGFQHPPVNGCSTASCNFSVLTRGAECTFFYSTILNQSPTSNVSYLDFQFSKSSKGASPVQCWQIFKYRLSEK